MPHYDVFNGDADGLCALQQLRLNQPQDSHLVTGIKRDIQLLKQVHPQPGDSITVLDISLDKNRDDLLRLLDAETSIEYFDHHFAGEIPQSPQLQTHIDTSPTTCTSLLVNQALQGKYAAWAVVGAFGDNFYESATQAAAHLSYSSTELEQLTQLGTYLNYNGYGSSLEDLHYRPDELFKQLQPYANPLDFIRESDAFKQLKQGYLDDMAQTEQLQATLASQKSAVFILPNKAWAKRCSGVFGNQLARQYPERGHALLTELHEGGYLVSVRAPKTNPTGADDICRSFPTGGGRKAAAGINHLPNNLYDQFIDTFQKTYD